MVVAGTLGLCSAGPSGQSRKGSIRQKYFLLLLWAVPPPLLRAEAPELENLCQKICCHQVSSSVVVLEVTSPSLCTPGTCLSVCTTQETWLLRSQSTTVCVSCAIGDRDACRKFQNKIKY